ncbi:MAG TPA: hypothetical protein DDZ78_06275, partial [Porphyromonadaceae bacterium]|nr:hypothetical protein [Porphyromonadaceae bacterium]
IDVRTLSRDLGIPVVAASARSKEGIPELLKTVHQMATGSVWPSKKTVLHTPDKTGRAID